MAWMYVREFIYSFPPCIYIGQSAGGLAQQSWTLRQGEAPKKPQFSFFGSVHGTLVITPSETISEF
jgi:hypothetical protein